MTTIQQIDKLLLKLKSDDKKNNPSEKENSLNLATS